MNQSTPPPPTPEDIFLANQATIARIVAFVCRRHHASAAEAQDFASRTSEKLIEHDYAILRKFEGRSKLSTYLTITIERLFLDHRNAEWGKWRPSAVARRGGAAAILLERLMVRDGYTFDEAVEFMATVPTITASRAELDAIAARLPARAQRRFEPDAVLASLPAPPTHNAVEHDERQALADRIARVLRQQKEGLPPQERLILALRFEDGESIAHIAAMLGLEQKSLYRRMERLLHDLRAGMEVEGIGAAEVAYLFEKSTHDLNLDGH